MLLALAVGLPLFAPFAVTLYGISGSGLNFAAEPLAPQSALFGIGTAALVASSPLPRFRLDIIGLPLVAALLGAYSANARPGILALFISGLVCMWAVRRLGGDFPDKYMRTAAGIAAAVALYGILQAAWSRLFSGVVLVNPFGDRILSTLGNPTFLADYLALNLPLALALALAARRPGAFASWGICFSLIASAIVLTGSKGGQAAAALSVSGLVGLALWRRRLGLGRALALAVMSALTAGTLFLYTSAFKSSVSRWSDPQEGFSYSQRLEIFRGSLRLIAASPLRGHGPGSFPVVFPSVQSAELDQQLGVTLSVNHAHNDFLELAADLGIPAIGAVFAVGLLCLRGAPRSFPAAGLAFGLAAGLLAMQANFLIFLPTSLFILCVYSGMLLPGSVAGGAVSEGRPAFLFRLSLSAYLAIAAAASFLANGYYDLGAKAVASGKAGPARQSLVKAAILSPYNRHIWQNLGRAHELELDWPGAVAAYEKAADLGPHQAITHLNLGRTEWAWYYSTRDGGHLDRALAFLGEATRLNPYRSDAREWAGELALAAGRDEDASFFLDGFPPEFGFTPRLLWLRAKWLNGTGRTQEALEAMREGDALAAQAEIDRAESQLAAGKAAEAEATARRLVDRFPELPVALEALGYVLGVRGKNEEARDCFARIVNLDPGSLSGHLNMALLSLNMRDLRGARLAWNRAHALAPESPEVRLTLARLLAHEGKFPEAKREYARLLEIDPQNEAARMELERLSR